MRIGDFSGGTYDINTVESFGWYGEDIRINPELSELDLIDLAEEAAQTSTEDIKQITFIKDSFRKIIHSGDFDRFWATAKAKRLGLAELMQVQTKVIEYIAKRPTQLPSGSADGQSVIEGTSAQKQDSTVSPLTAMDVRYAEREMEGRPELRLALLQQAEHRSA